MNSWFNCTLRGFNKAIEMIKEGIKAYKFAKTFKKYKNADSESEKIKAAKLLSNIFEQEGGIFLKVAQYLGTQKEQAEEIKNLSLKNDPVISKELFVEILETQYGNDISNIFKNIDDRAFSASIGQVQKGILLGDQPVAIKVQYPKIKEKLHEQLKLLNLIPTSVPEKKWGVDINQYKKMIKELLDHEVDYNYEKKIMLNAEKAFSKYDFIKVPEVHEGLCTESILISEFIDGLHANELDTLTSKDRKNIAENLVRSLIVMIKERFFQADSNHGNFLFIKDPAQIALIDYGQFKELTPTFSKALMGLIYNLSLNKKIDYGAYFVALGFSDKKLIKIQSSLEILAKIVFEPFTKNFPYSLEDWSYKSKIDLCLGEDKWWFRSAGGEEFFLVMKSFMGIKNLIDKLDICVNWQQLFLDLVKDFEDEVKNYKPDPVERLPMPKQFMGEALSIHIKENEQDKVRLKLQLNVLYDFKENIGPDITEKLESKGIDVEKIAQETIRSGAKPGILFELIDGNKEYHVSIV